MSTKGRTIPFHVPVEPSELNGLRETTHVKCEQVLTVSKARLLGGTPLGWETSIGSLYCAPGMSSSSKDPGGRSGSEASLRVYQLQEGTRGLPGQRPADCHKSPADRDERPAERNERPADQDERSIGWNGRPADRNRPPIDPGQRTAELKRRFGDWNGSPTDRNKRPAGLNGALAGAAAGPPVSERVPFRPQGLPPGETNGFSRSLPVPLRSVRS